MIAIIDYNAGNLGSVANALTRLNIESVISDNPNVIRNAQAIILPGVGSAQAGMKSLREKKLDQVLISEINKGKPFLGICLGMQLLFETSEEGNTKCLGILKGKVIKFRKEKKVPQIGWNRVEVSVKGIPNNSYFYFVNSYYCVPFDKSIVAATTTYGETFASVIVKDNIIATQFHPEKSGNVGFQLLENFMKGTL